MKSNFERIAEKVKEEMQHTFNPEFLNRLDDVIVFHPLTEQNIGDIVAILLKDVQKRLGDEELTLKLTDAASAFLVKHGYDEKFGARPLKRAIQKYIEDPLSEKILLAEFSKGDEIEVDLPAAGEKLEFLPGEGAFYGPKLEFHLRDAIGRTWQCGTHQLDFVLPERLEAEYVGEDGAKHRPVMFHRAIYGSFERFLGILIEHYAGAFPLWMAPVQVVVATITQEADGYAREVAEQMKRAGLRVELDLRNEKVGYKVREHSLQKIPVIAVVGRKEAEEKTVALRRLGGDAQTVMALDAAAKAIANEALPPDLR